MAIRADDVPHEAQEQTHVITAQDLRETFLRFFEDRGHLRMPSASLIPAADPTLLLTNAGMAPFKAYFSGELEPPRKRITTVQKSFRTTDIEEVGDATHMTLFEMLGNFSFGDYFKEEACEWGLELMTDALGFDPERLYITIYEDDDAAEQIWLKLGVPAGRIYRFGASENWWGPAGTEGPCGPCSEIHLYRGDMAAVPSDDDPALGTTWGPNIHDDFIELYNLVFTQYYRDLDGNDIPLPKNNIDTGMGLERTICAIQGVDSPYESDVFLPIVKRVEELSGCSMGQGGEVQKAIRVVAEHARSASFLIGDGVVPGNTGRGYVLRRLIRRGMLFGRSLELESPVLAVVADIVAETLGDTYPELKSNFPFIKRTLEFEENNFARTLEFGTSVLGGMIRYRVDNAEKVARLIDALERESDTADSHADLFSTGSDSRSREDAASTGIRAATEAAKSGIAGFRNAIDDAGGPGKQSSEVATARESLMNWSREITGREAFLLYDTYGFPLEVTTELLTERNMAVDQNGFNAEMDRQRERARAASAGFSGDAEQRRIYEQLGVDYTEFLGYEGTTAESVVIGMIKGGVLVHSASMGEDVEVVLRETPFYAEKGGQIGDTGRITSANADITVNDTQSPYARLAVHHAHINEGELRVGDTVTAAVDYERREQIRRNHTATHLLHAALREIVGLHVRQSGSLVAPDRLRFDFTHMSPLSKAEIRAVQDRVNEKIRANADVHIHHTTYSKAIDDGALAFFGDTYDNEVRTVRIDHPWSFELCGGTHMDHTGGIGAFMITSESGIGAGVRRMEALTGIGAEEAISEVSDVLDSLSASLSAPVDQLVNRTQTLLDEVDNYRKRVAALEDEILAASLGDRSTDSSGQQFTVACDNIDVPVEVRRIPASNSAALRRASDSMRTHMGTGIAVLGAVFDDRPLIMVMVTKDLVGKGLHAGQIVRQLGRIMGGGGGGGPHLAQAGGRDSSKLDDAFAAARGVIEEAANSSGEPK